MNTASFIESLASLPMIGFAVMVLLPTGFVLALTIALMRESKGWLVVSILLGVLLAVATVVLVTETNSLVDLN